MKFDFIIGNPPYQADTENTAWDGQIYHYFIESAYSIADKVELITPGRFLFNAGKTPKEWNKKMLSDRHFKVLRYEPDSKKIFPNTDIMGGIAIHFRDKTVEGKAIGTFVIQKEELYSILEKVRSKNERKIDNLIFPYSSYTFSDVFREEQTDIVKELPNKQIIASNLFSKLENKIFFLECPNDNDNYIQLYGRKDNERVFMWVKSKYINVAQNFEYYKLFIPAANGCSAVGAGSATSVIGKPVFGDKFIGHNQTFISLGYFSTKFECFSALKYIKTKFARTMIGTLKVTQNGKKAVYANVPMQDFTEKSDIDWSKSIHEIDLQLYEKYGLDEHEIDFIEKNVKEME